VVDVGVECLLILSSEIMHSFDALATELEEAATGFLRTNLQAPLDHGIKAIKALLGHPDWSRQTDQRCAMLLSQGAGCLLHRFKLTGTRKDLDEAVLLLRVGEKLLAPDDASRGPLLGNLASALRNVAEQDNNDVALDQAIALHREARVLGADEITFVGRTMNLGMALFERFEFRGDKSNLDEARALLAVAYEKAPNPQQRGAVATNRAILDRAAFSHGGALRDLEAAIEHGREALQHSPPGHPKRAIRLNNLAIALSERLTTTGRLEDGGEAVSLLIEGLEGLREDHAEFAMRALNLGNAQMALFLAGHNRTDLEAACATYERAEKAVASGHAYRAAILMAFADALALLGRLNRDRAQCDVGVQRALDAVTETSRESAMRGRVLNAAANALLHRAEVFGDAADTIAAATAAAEAIAYTPTDSAERVLLVMTVLRARRLKAHLTNDPAAKLATIGVGRAVLSAVVERALQPGGGARLMDQAISARRGLVEDAIAAGDAALAVELMEEGKATGLRRDINRAERVPEGLSQAEQTEYRSHVDRLRALNIFLAAHAGPPDGVRRADLAAEAGAIIAHLRSMEAKDHTFSVQALDWLSIRAIAKQADAALVYLSAGDQEAGAAIVLHGASPDRGPEPEDVVRLDALNEHILFMQIQRGLDFTLDQMTALMANGAEAAASELGWSGAYKAARMNDLPAPAQRTAFSVWRRKIDETLEWLDSAWMARIAQRLKVISAKRCVLIVDARLAAIPLHAAKSLRLAGLEGVSYSPSAAILSAALRPNSPSPRLAAAMIANPDGSLPFAYAEAHALCDVIEKAGGTVESGSGLKWLQQASQNVHHIILSTHAVFNPADPYASRFVLDSEGGGLTLAALLAGALPLGPGTSIYANACETAMIDARLATDEHLGFPGAFLLAGARFVMASLWQVDDVSTAIFGTEMMRRRAAGQGSPEAATAAMEFVRTLKKGDAIKFLETIKVGVTRTDLAERIDVVARRLRLGPDIPFAHPIYWACFAPNGL
jgi:CHAT domain-containing protein/tetratricopeptide (TPR) repeat protein